MVTRASNHVIKDGSISTEKIADGAATTAKIADGAVTVGKLSGNGTAYGADIQSSPTDTTAGRLLLVGAFGIGTNSPSGPISDADDALVNGWVRTDSSTSNTPAEASSSFGLIRIEARASNRVKQTFIPISSNLRRDEYSRIFDGAVFTDWVKISNIILGKQIYTLETESNYGGSSMSSFFLASYTPVSPSSRLLIETTVNIAVERNEQSNNVSAAFRYYRGAVSNNNPLGNEEYQLRMAHSSTTNSQSSPNFRHSLVMTAEYSPGTTDAQGIRLARRAASDNTVVTTCFGDSTAIMKITEIDG